jgi:thioredoxin reductase
VFTRDGTPPSELLKVARRQLEPYDVTLRDQEITDIGEQDQRFELRSESGSEAIARKVVFASGMVDLMPEIPGIEQFWGKTVVHCPYCHGWEIRGEPLAALVNAKTALNFATLLRGWTDDLILLSDGAMEVEDENRNNLKARGIEIREDKIVELSGTDGHLKHIIFENGESIERKALFIEPRQRQQFDLHKKLGLEYDDEGNIKTNRFSETSRPGIYVAGDAGPNMQQITIAAASGAEVGIGINHKMLEEDFNQMEWQAR